MVYWAIDMVVDRIYDVVVVGAGPAGSAVARDIAGAGFKTLLVEEHACIGEPLHCAGLVSPRTLALASVGDDVVLNQLTGAFINGPGGGRLAVGGERVHALAIDRVRFDRELAAQAQARGAELSLQSRLMEIQREGRGLRLWLERRGRREEVRARLLVGADGAHSRVATWLGVRPRPSEKVVCLGIEARMRAERDDFAEVFVGNSLAPGFFAWFIPLQRDRVRIGIGTSNGRKPSYYLHALEEAFPRCFDGMEVIRFYGGVIPLGQPVGTYGQGVLLVGDAAGQVKPTSGGGIYTGLVGAKHCAAVAVEALAADDLSSSFLSRYHRAWRREMGSELDRGQDLRRVFMSLRDRDMDRLLALMRTPGLQRLVSAYGDIDFPSRLAARLVRVAPFFLRFVRVPLNSSWPHLRSFR